MVYLITYDKNTPFSNYNNLENAILESGYNWVHPMKNTWLISTNLKANEIYNRIALHLSTEDRIIVIQVNADYQGWLDEEVWQWINSQLSNQSGVSFGPNWSR